MAFAYCVVKVNGEEHKVVYIKENNIYVRGTAKCLVTPRDLKTPYLNY